MNQETPEPAKETIRILHTADWHLGREFHGHDLSALHRAFFDWLAQEVEARQVDLVVMAGDIYDRALPPVSAISLFNEQVARLSELAPIILVTGNHDSTVRMSHGPLLRPGIHLRSGIDSIGDPILIDSPFPLAIYPIPYLDPLTVAIQLDLDESTHDAVIGEAVRRSRVDLDDRPGTRAIAIGHAFITGASTCDSERSIQVGGAEDVSSSVYSGFDYVALGHLHRPQGIGDRVRYAGSPIPLSYSEVGAGAEKSVAIIDLSFDGSIEIETAAIPQQVTMRRISGELETLLADGSLKGREDDWFEIILTDEVRPDQPMDRLKTRFRNVISLRFLSPISDARNDEAVRLTELATADPGELVKNFLEEVRGAGPSEMEKALINEALESKTGEEVRS